MLKRWGLLMVGVCGLAGCAMQPDADDTRLPNWPPPPPLAALAPPPAWTAPPPRPPAPVYTPPPPAPRWTPRPQPQPNQASVPAAWIPEVRASHWLWIIVHHSDSNYGSAAIIDKWHRDRGFDELGYDFVIGNGTNSGDGQIEVGPRWIKQKWGAHDNALDNRFNKWGIGICLVGNFNDTRPTPAQMHSLIRLISYLGRTYHISADRIMGHGETKDTECPGKYLSVGTVRSQVQPILAESDNKPSPGVADAQRP